METINTIAYTLLSVLLIGLVGYVIHLRRQVLKLYKDILELTLQKGIMLDKLSDALDALEKKPVEQTDGFLKFITESRDYAFSFIEVMQASIQEFEDDTKDILDKESSEDIKKIKMAYQALREKTMPNDIPNN